MVSGAWLSAMHDVQGLLTKPEGEKLRFKRDLSSPATTWTTGHLRRHVPKCPPSRA